MAPKFGTSGLRGLVTDLTSNLIADHVTAFLAACDAGQAVCVGRDLRASSPRIAEDVARTAAVCGHRVIEMGALPTPALALAAAARDACAVMVTGSHIPDDRNGLKFYTPAGEITKQDEAAILAALGLPVPRVPPGPRETLDTASRAYITRYVSAFGADALAGWRIGVYEHSAVGRDHLKEVLTALGAELFPFGRSETFMPVDTEALEPDMQAAMAERAVRNALDAIVSLDGDSDRPLLCDEAGRVVPGDVMGQIAAEWLGAQTVVTPVSSNSGVLQKGFERVVRTRIGSPFVIAAMMAAEGRVIGYEANGGFLLGFEAAGPKGPIPPLMTRDALLPILAVLVTAGAAPLSQRIAAEPPCVTRAGRLQEVPPMAMRVLVGELATNLSARAAFLSPLGLRETKVDLTDGVRMHLSDGTVLHIRPSGNAPELRLYVEAASPEVADRQLAEGLAHLRRSLSG